MKSAVSVSESISQPLLTIAVSVYNCKDTVLQTLESISGQVCGSVEVIVTDDASADRTSEIISDYVSKRPFIRFFRHERNLGAHITRLENAEHAKGRYVWLFDGDDTLAPGALQKILRILKKYDYDIIHIGCRIINEDHLDPERIKRMEKFAEPYHGKLVGEDVFKKCFIDNEYGFNTWNKIIRSDLLRRSAELMERSAFPKAQDKYEYYVISSLAKSYRGFPKIIGYEYHFGNGVTGHNDVSPGLFSKYCRMSEVSDAIARYSAGKEQYYNEASVSSRRLLVADCMGNWYRLDKKDRAKGFDAAVTAWGAVDTISTLAERKWFRPGEIADSVFGADCIKSENKPIKKIATYYHRLYGGGVQRVISCLVSLWVDSGYEVVIITDEAENPKDFPLCPGVKRYVLPQGSNTRENYRFRAEELKNILVSEKIDLFVDHAWVSNTLLWDMLICKIAGVKCAIYSHNVFAMLAGSGYKYFADLPRTFALANGIVVLSKTDEKFWRNFNNNVYCVKNPLSFDPSSCRRSELDSNTILWIGRFSPEKNPLDAIEIFKEVHDRRPLVRLIMAGAGDINIENGLKKKMKTYHLENSVEFPGYVEDVREYYAKASVFLSTSEYEGYPMTFTEAMSAGVPGVYYELPYLEVVREGAGFVQVPQKDVHGAASEICRILSDTEYRKSLGISAAEYADTLAEYDLTQRWNDIFSDLEQNDCSRPDTEETDLMWDTLLRFYCRGLDKRAEKITDSVSYRIGRALTYIPRRFLKK